MIQLSAIEMGSAIGWYGPLIDLSQAPSHIGDFVQLLVFVHRSIPFQYKSFKGHEVIRTDLMVGDDTLPQFSVSIWQKQMGAMVSAGEVILLQNVKITNFRDLIEARTVQWSSLLRLIHPYESLLSNGIEVMVSDCRVGTTTKDKLRRVIEWVRKAAPAPCSIKPHCHQKPGHLSRNWKVLEELKSRGFYSLSEVYQLTDSCRATFFASVGEIFLTSTRSALGDNEKMFLSTRLFETGESSLVKDLICHGCQLCGSPLESKFEQDAMRLICLKTSNHLHAVNWIYRPFMLYVWDESDYIPLLVKNKAAEILFGNIKAEKVYQCNRGRNKLKGAGNGVLDSCLFDDDDDNKRFELKRRQPIGVDFYQIWLILLKYLLQQGKNSPLKFEIIINPTLDEENGKFEMVSASVPCFRLKNSQ